MDRRKRTFKANVETVTTARPSSLSGMGASSPGQCTVCGARDARLLVMLELRGGQAATLCGSHALMHRRDGEVARTAAELRERLGDRRDHARRAEGEGDELAERLSAAFTRDRRRTERRVG